MTAAQSMTFKVRKLDVASQAVRLALGSSDEGRMNGKSATPAVRMTERQAREEPMKAVSVFRVRQNEVLATWIGQNTGELFVECLLHVREI